MDMALALYHADLEVTKVMRLRLWYVVFAH